MKMQNEHVLLYKLFSHEAWVLVHIKMNLTEDQGPSTKDQVQLSSTSYTERRSCKYLRLRKLLKEIELEHVYGYYD